MENLKKDAVIVTGDNAELVQRSTEIKRTASAKSDAEEATTGLRSPMDFFDTPEDAQTVQKADNLAHEIRNELGLADDPVLIPAKDGETIEDTITRVAGEGEAAALDSNEKIEAMTGMRNGLVPYLTTADARTSKVFRFDSRDTVFVYHDNTPDAEAPAAANSTEAGSEGKVNPTTAQGVDTLTQVVGQHLVQPKQRLLLPQSSRSGPTDRDLELMLLRRVTLKRVEDQLYVWNGVFFSPLTKNGLDTLIIELMPEIGQRGSFSPVAGISKFLAAEPTIIGKPEDADHPDILAVANGHLRLSDLQLLPANPNLFLTSRVAAPWLGPQPCPVFERFLFDVTEGDQVLTRRIWQAIGFILVPGSNLKRFLLLFGPGNTGKSVLGNLLAAFFDPAAISAAPISTLGGNFGLEPLLMKRLNLAMDLTGDCVSEKSVAAVKTLTGGDYVSVARKYKLACLTKLTSGLVFGTNHPIHLRSMDQAFADRILLIPFMNPVPHEKMDRRLGEKLKAELPGILYHAIIAFKELERAGFHFAGDDLYPGSSAVVVDKVIDSDADLRQQWLLKFLAASCKQEPKAFLPTENLFAVYNRYATAEMPHFANSEQFSRQIKVALDSFSGGTVEKAKRRVDGQPVNGFFGVKLQDDALILQ